MRRILLSALMGLGVAVPVGATVLAGAPGAAFAAGSGVKCSALTGTITGNVTVSSCTPANKKYASASAATSTLASGGGTVTWTPSGKTTVIAVTFKQAGTACPAGTSEYEAKGSVTGGTAKYTKTGDKVKVDVCVNTTTGAITLAPGTKVAL
jgi:hypothetical protein